VSRTHELADAFAAMPRVLMGLVSFFAVFGAGSVLLALAPGVEHRVAGATLGQAGFFASGHGVFALVFGAWLAASALGMLRRASWGRWGAVAAWAFFVPAEAALAEAPRVALQAGLAAVWAAAVAAYLFRAPGPAAYFRPAAASATE
jgi:hypothetical protein